MEQLIQETYQTVNEALNSVHKKRKRVLVFQKLMWIITGLFFVLMILTMATSYFPDIKSNFLGLFGNTNQNPYASYYPFIGLILLLYPASFIFVSAFRKFKVKEAETIAKMVSMLFPKVEFTQQAAAPITEVTKSKLFAWTKKDTPVYSYGQIRSSSNDRIVNIADIGIIEKNVSNRLFDGLMRIPGLNMLAMLYQYVLKNILTNKSADNNYYTFRGLFCWTRFKKKLEGHTVILTNNQQTKIGRYFGSNFNEEQKITLEDPRFTDQFIVYSTDQIEARYVLSSALMERIVQLKEKFDQPILLSFQNNEMYLAVQNEHGIFSFPAGKLDGIKIIEELAHDIKTALDISTELNFR